MWHSGLSYAVLWNKISSPMFGFCFKYNVCYQTSTGRVKKGRVQWNQMNQNLLHDWPSGLRGRLADAATHSVVDSNPAQDNSLYDPQMSLSLGVICVR